MIASAPAAPSAPPQVIAYLDGRLVVLDQTRLPAETRHATLSTLDEVVQAIRGMVVRGAPLIGVTAAFGVCVALAGCRSRDEAQRRAPDALKALRASRPTAVNLFWALERMETAVAALPEQGWMGALEREARAIHEDGVRQDQALIQHGIALLVPDAQVITHCNTGPLATGGMGTALGVLIEGSRVHGGMHVYVDETRPRWQGAHLTTWELAQARVPHTLIADNAAAFLMRRRKIHSVWVGADRIANNGDTANKIGTYHLALAAKHHGVPFYVAAPSSTVDATLRDGAGIPIEERAPEEVTAPEGHALTLPGTAAWNPAFDVTPAALITAIVTEKGVFLGPKYNLRKGLG